MKGKMSTTVLAGLLLLGSAPISIAGEDLGKQEFNNNCTICHGFTGKGDGLYAGMLQVPVTDLTVLQKNNNGVFPFNRVFDTIDGREMIRAHGLPDMPIWGSVYSRKATAYYTEYYSDQDIERFVKARILALTSYIYGLQVK